MIVDAKKRLFVFAAFVERNSLLLAFSTIIANIWANVDLNSYQHLLHLELFKNNWIGIPHGGHKVINLHYAAESIGMSLFFALGAVEVRRFILRLMEEDENWLKKLSLPLFGTLGGVCGPICVYFFLAVSVGKVTLLSAGWAIPTATDMAFSYMFAKIIFRKDHPAICFLLLLALLDDVIGLCIIAVFLPQGPVNYSWLLLIIPAIALGLFFRYLKIWRFWPYVFIAGPISWLGMALAGLHPALGLLPIVPIIPSWRCKLAKKYIEQGKDPLTIFEHKIKWPVQIALGLFGLVASGVCINLDGAEIAMIVEGALLFGKPLGIVLFTYIGMRLIKTDLPTGMKINDLWIVGFLASIGFTVALFMAGASYKAGLTQGALKLGALISIFNGVIALGIAKCFVKTKKPILKTS